MEKGADVGLAEVEDAPALLREPGHPGRDVAGEQDGAALANPFRRPAEDFPETRPGLPDEQEFDLRLAARAPEPGRHDPGVVEDQDVAGAHEPGEFAEPAVVDRPGVPVDDHQPGVVAMREGMLGDELRREIVIEIGDAERLAGGHGRSRSLQSLNSFFWPGAWPSRAIPARGTRSPDARRPAA